MDSDYSANSETNTQPNQRQGLANDDKDRDDQQAHDLVNYKGIYFDDNNEKYIDDSTGAHFRYDEIYQ